MIDKYYKAVKTSRNYSADVFSLGSKFTINTEMGYHELLGSNFNFHYDDIAFNEVSRDYISTFSNLLEAFVNDFFDPDKKYCVNENLILNLVTVDDKPALLCTISYLTEERSTDKLEEEVFLDRTEAFNIVQNIKYALTLSKTYTLRSI